MVPEVHHKCTFLFAMQFLLARLRSRTSLANYIFSCNFLQLYMFFVFCFVCLLLFLYFFGLFFVCIALYFPCHCTFIDNISNPLYNCNLK